MASQKSAKLSLEIIIELDKKTLKLFEIGDKSASSRLLFSADIVSGCEGTATPTGNYVSGKWIKDKTNPRHGPIPWSTDNWANPYGPYFLQILNAKTYRYTMYGIHGTRGPLIGNFEKPPMSQSILEWFLDDDESTKYLYCSHGCIRMSNQNITKLFQLMSDPKYGKYKAPIKIQK